MENRSKSTSLCVSNARLIWMMMHSMHTDRLLLILSKLFLPFEGFTWEKHFSKYLFILISTTLSIRASQMDLKNAWVWTNILANNSIAESKEWKKGNFFTNAWSLIYRNGPPHWYKKILQTRLIPWMWVALENHCWFPS